MGNIAHDVLRRQRLAGVLGGAGATLPVSIDFSTKSDGALPAPLTGATWTVVSGAAKNTPATIGAEMFTDPGLENWASANNLTSWSEYTAGTSTFNQDSAAPHGGTYNMRMDVDAGGTRTEITQSPAGRVAGNWYRVIQWLKGSAAITPRHFYDNQLPASNIFGVGTSWTETIAGYLYRTGGIIGAQSIGNGSKSVHVDDLSHKALTTTELFAFLPATQANIILKADWTYPVMNQSPAGLILNLDSITNPQNYVVVILSGANSVVYVFKVVGGTPQASVAAYTATYVAGATLEVRKSGTSYQTLYNGTSLGTATISDAGIINNTIHGLFSIHPGVTCDFFSAAPN